MINRQAVYVKNGRFGDDFSAFISPAGDAAERGIKLEQALSVLEINFLFSSLTCPAGVAVVLDFLFVGGCFHCEL